MVFENSESGKGRGPRPKGDMYSITSHELKSPLQAIRLQVEMAQRKLENEGAESFTSQALKAIFNRAQRDIARLTRLVEDMQDVSRLECGKFSLQPEYFHLDEFLDDFVMRIQHCYPESKNLIRVNFHAPVIVYWDKLRIEQTLINLLTNSFRYGHGSPICLTTMTGGGMVYLTVRDEGPGIPSEVQQRIFEPFERGSKNFESEGLGLGLYICSEIVKAHEGNIVLQSIEGQGSMFTMIIPTQVKKEKPQ